MKEILLVLQSEKAEKIFNYTATAVYFSVLLISVFIYLSGL